MNIKPYVYKLIHKESHQFYIGYREANKVPALEDLGIKYFSSSKKVKSLKFENFNYEILEEFDHGNEAYKFENKLIKEHFENPLCLNCFYMENGKKKFSAFGTKASTKTRGKIGDAHRGKTLSSETKEKISAKLRGFKHTDEARMKMSEAGAGRKQNKDTVEKRNKKLRGQKRTPETCLKMSEAAKGRILSIETREKLSEAGKGKSVSLETREKLSNSNRGQKRSPETCLKMSEAAKGRILSQDHKDNMKKSRSGDKNKTALIWTVIRESDNYVFEIKSLNWCKDLKIRSKSLSNTLKTKKFYKGYKILEKRKQLIISD